MMTAFAEKEPVRVRFSVALAVRPVGMKVWRLTALAVNEPETVLLMTAFAAKEPV